MKRTIALVLSIVLLFALCVPAFGDVSKGSYAGSMRVVNCEEWVSLRKTASTGGTRLAEVPLGATLTECVYYDGNWMYGNYNGQKGFVLAKYLEPVADCDWLVYNGSTLKDVQAFGKEALKEQVGDYVILATRAPFDEGEGLMVGCFAADGRNRWCRFTACPYMTELDNTDAFIAGEAGSPVVMVYNGGLGLAALDIETGAMLWELSNDQVSLGGCISHAVAEDGTMYIGGYYGPDPVCIGSNGEVYWEAETGDENIYWLYQIEIQADGLLCYYEHVADEQEGLVVFDFDGNLVSTDTL